MIFDGSEVKSGRRFEITVSQPLVPYLETYLREVRPMFAGASEHVGLWASQARRPLTANAIARVISDRTRDAYGHAVSPHLFRHCAATTVATLEPGRIDIARELLGHTSLSTTHVYYNKASSIHAGRIYASVLAEELSAARRLARKTATQNEMHSSIPKVGEEKDRDATARGVRRRLRSSDDL